MKTIDEVKILATLGPASMKKSIVENMDSAGVDLFRINLSHTNIEDLEKIIQNIKNWTKKPICIDTEGAQIRTAKIKNSLVDIKNNSLVLLTSSEILGDESHLPLYPIKPSEVLELGDVLAIDFYSTIVRVVSIEGNNVYARVVSGGQVFNNKAVSLNRLINLPNFTKKDIRAFEIAKKMGLAYLALSFASDKEGVRRLRDFFPHPIFAISKIESRLGLTNLEDICRVSNAILIDRGDLSREVPLQKIALAQKHILDTAKKLRVPVYVATNLLESMVENFSPTRAEINDITSTLLDGSRGLVLAAETAIGRYPVQSVRMAVNVKKEVENYINSDKKRYFDSL